MHTTAKGEVIIPADIREQAGLMPHTEVDFAFDGKVARIVPAARARKESRGDGLVAHLRRRGGAAMWR